MDKPSQLLMHIRYNMQEMPPIYQKTTLRLFRGYWKGDLILDHLVDLGSIEDINVFQNYYFAFLKEEDNAKLDEARSRSRDLGT